MLATGARTTAAPANMGPARELPEQRRFGVAGRSRATARTWRARVPPRMPITSVEWARFDGAMLATSSADHTVCVWDLAVERDAEEAAAMAAADMRARAGGSRRRSSCSCTRGVRDREEELRTGTIRRPADVPHHGGRTAFNAFKAYNVERGGVTSARRTRRVRELPRIIFSVRARTPDRRVKFCIPRRQPTPCRRRRARPMVRRKIVAASCHVADRRSALFVGSGETIGFARTTTRFGASASSPRARAPSSSRRDADGRAGDPARRGGAAARVGADGARTTRASARRRRRGFLVAAARRGTVPASSRPRRLARGARARPAAARLASSDARARAPG